MLCPNVGIGDGKSLFLLLLLLLLMMMLLLLLLMIMCHALLLLLLLLLLLHTLLVILLMLMLRWLLQMRLRLLSKVGLWRWRGTPHHPWLLHWLRAACPWSHIDMVVHRRGASGPRPCHWALTTSHRRASSRRQHRARAATLGPVRRWRRKSRGPARVWLRLSAARVCLRSCAPWVCLRSCAPWVWLRLSTALPLGREHLIAWGRLALVGGWCPRGNAPLHRCGTSAGRGLTRLLLLMLMLMLGGSAVAAGGLSVEESL